MTFAAPGVDVTLLQQQAQAESAKARARAGGVGSAGGGKHSQKAARAAAEDFEAMFLAQLLQPMFKGLKADGMFGGGPGEEVYRSMMVEEYGKAIAKAGGVGIADHVYAEILKLQEVAK